LDVRDFFGQGQNGFFFCGVNIGFAPCVEQKDAFGSLGVFERIGCVHVDTERTAIDLRCADFDQFFVCWRKR
jgi:hypothetical protein